MMTRLLAYIRVVIFVTMTIHAVTAYFAAQAGNWTLSVSNSIGMAYAGILLIISYLADRRQP